MSKSEKPAPKAKAKEQALPNDRVELTRPKGANSKGKATYGFVVVYRDNVPRFSSLSLERDYLDNKKNISAVKKGTYPLILEYSPAFSRKLWELKDVEDRSECKFHPGSYWTNLQGCISLGLDFVDMDGDGTLDLSDSVKTIDRFHRALAGLNKTVVIIK